MSTERRQLGGIQVLRGIAAAAVVFDHASAMAELPKYYGHPMLPILKAGTTGVELFFVLSGFIICYTALAPSTLAPAIDIRDFMAKRFTRIVPYMWAVVLAYAVLRLVGRDSGFDPVPYLRALSLWPVGEMAPNVVWTLRHEFLFYGLFALTFLTGRPWLLPIWCAAPLGASWFVSDGSLAWFLTNNENLMFGAGVIIGLAFLKAKDARTFGLLPLMAATGAVFTVAALLNFDRRELAHVCVLLPFCAVVIWIAARTRISGTIGMLGRRLGDASFSIYLVHTLFISAALGVLSKHWPQAPAPLLIFVLAASGIAAGTVLHYAVERPLIRLASRRVAPRKPALA